MKQSNFNKQIKMPFRNPCRLVILDNFFGSLGFHLLVWSEVTESQLRVVLRVLLSTTPKVMVSEFLRDHD